jgi:hypothetical protein
MKHPQKLLGFLSNRTVGCVEVLMLHLSCITALVSLKWDILAKLEDWYNGGF